MTWSIVARDAATGAFGVAVTTCAFAVGGRCPAGSGRIGALSSQAKVNPLYCVDGLRLLAEGRRADEIVAALTAPDAGRETRQLHVIDAAGRIQAYTGANCVPWAGHVAGEDVSVAGNMLAGPDVVARTLEVYQANLAKPFAERFLLALEAGQEAGGDKRGKQSAAIKIWTSEPYAALDIRVDDSPEPLPELRRLYEVAWQRYLPMMQAAPTRADPAGVWDDDQALERYIEQAKTWPRSL